MIDTDHTLCRTGNPELITSMLLLYLYVNYCGICISQYFMHLLHIQLISRLFLIKRTIFITVTAKKRKLFIIYLTTIQTVMHSIFPLPFLQSFVHRQNIFVTQCPLQTTVVDFWTLIYDTDSSTVVILEAMNNVSLGLFIKV